MPRRNRKRSKAESATIEPALPPNRTPGTILGRLGDDGRWHMKVVVDTEGNTRLATAEEEAREEALFQQKLQASRDQFRADVTRLRDDPEYEPPADDRRYRQYVRWVAGFDNGYAPTMADLLMKDAETTRIVRRHVRKVYGERTQTPPPVWSEPKTRKQWASLFKCSMATFDRRRRDGTIRWQFFGTGKMIQVDQSCLPSGK